MDLISSKPLLKTLAIGVVFVFVMIAGCQLTFQKNGWNEKKWGPLVPHTNFPGDCGMCHLPDRWDKLRDDFVFDHEKETGYALNGAHSQAACLRCHNDRGPVQVYTARGCSGCHVDPHNFQQGMDCTKCHTEISWRPVGLISEHARTRFPLMGVHAVTDCESCHEGAAAGRYVGAPTQCVACHQDDLARAVNPDHAANGWTANCQECHLPSGWTAAFIGHDFFALSGGHGGLDCTQCHVGGVYTGLSSDCFGCHQDDYNATTNPDHAASGFSTDCASCHTISGWTPASFNHTAFPLSGPHNLSCIECHTTGSYQQFSCIDCHEHRQSEVDPKHREVNGYSYNSQACYQCHPNGRH